MSVDIAAVLRSQDPAYVYTVVTDLLQIGSGTYGIVYKALVLKSVPVAIKHGHEGYESDIKREAKVAAAIADMEGFAHLYTMFKAPEPWPGNPSLTCGYVIPMLAYEYIQGETMREWLFGCTDRELVDVLITIFGNLDAAYTQHGLVHCDLRLENVMITHDQKPVIIDFGVSKVSVDGVVIKPKHAVYTAPWIDASMLFLDLKRNAPNRYRRAALDRAEHLFPLYYSQESVKHLERADGYSHERLLSLLKETHVLDVQDFPDGHPKPREKHVIRKEYPINAGLTLSDIHECTTQDEYDDMMSLWHGYLVSLHPNIPVELAKKWNRVSSDARDMYDLDVYFLGV